MGVTAPIPEQFDNLEMSMTERTYQGRRTERHLKAVLTGEQEGPLNESGDTELVSAWSVLVAHKGRVAEPVRVRWRAYRLAGGIVLHCFIQLDSPGVTSVPPVRATGYAPAGSWGADRASSAFDNALEAAGVELYGSPHPRAPGEIIDYRRRAYVDGAGEEALEEACTAIVEAMGYRGHVYIAKH